MCLLPANTVTHAGAGTSTGGYTNPDLTGNSSLLFDSESSSSSPESSSPVSSDDDTPPAQTSTSSWRRLEADKGHAQVLVKCSSSNGDKCSLDKPVIPSLAEHVDHPPLDLLNLPTPVEEVEKVSLVKVTFCNMRQNISDLRRKRIRARKKSHDSVKRRSSTLSTVSCSTAASISSVSSDIEDEPAMKRALPMIQECEVRPVSVAESHISIHSNPRIMEDELDSGLSDLENNDSLLKTCSQGPLLVLSSEHPVSIKKSHHVAHNSSNETLIIKSDLEILQPSNICQPQDQSRTSYFEDEIAEACDLEAADWLSDNDEEDHHQGSLDLNGSFLRSFLNQIQNDQRYNCSIPLVDMFQNSPLDSFICYGCSTPYSKSNTFTIDLKEHTISVICGHCQWWTTRRITTQTYSF